MRKKIADIIEEVYLTEVKSLVHDELQQRCEGCGIQERGACSQCAWLAGRHVWLLCMLILEWWVCIVASAVWLPGVLGVCSPILYLIRLI